MQYQTNYSCKNIDKQKKSKFLSYNNGIDQDSDNKFALLSQQVLLDDQWFDQINWQKCNPQIEKVLIKAHNGDGRELLEQQGQFQNCFVEKNKIKNCKFQDSQQLFQRNSQIYQSHFFKIIQKKKEEFNTKVKLCHQVYFNIMVIGEKGTGKTTFIQSFLNKKFITKEILRTQISEITFYRKFRQKQGIRLQVSMIDTPPLNESSIKTLKAYIKHKVFLNQKSMSHKQKLQGKYTSVKQIYQGNKTQIVDQRIHICILLLNKENYQKSLQLGMELNEIVNIIPVISRSDLYIEDQVKELKKTIKELITENKMKIVQLDYFLIDKNIKTQKIQYPPFAASCKNKNFFNTQFILIYNLLIGELCIPLIKLMDTFYRCKQNKSFEFKVIQNRNLFAFSIFTATVVGVFIGKIFLK